MGRPSIIKHAKNRGEIEAALLGNLGLEWISARFGVSVSTLRRHREHLFASLAGDIQEASAIAPTEYVERLEEIADGLRRVRNRAESTNDNASVVRASAAEAQVIRDLIDRLGIDDSDTADSLRDAQAIFKAIKRIVVNSPETGRELVAILRDQKAPESLQIAAQRLAEANLTPTLEGNSNV